MGKYFKEEETSNRIKRFKTSDVQEKNLKFAQIPRVIRPLDAMLDFAKTFVFKFFLKAPALLTVKPELVKALQQGVTEIITAQKSVSMEIQKKIKVILDEIDQAKAREKELVASLQNITDSSRRNKIISEVENINKRIIPEKIEALKPLKEERAKIKKIVIDEIDAKIQEFNRVNNLTSPVSWNKKLGNPEIEFLLGTPVSKRGTSVVMNRARPKESLNFLNLLNQTRRWSTKALDGFFSDKYSDRLANIGFFDKKYQFKVLQPNKTWKDINYSMSDLLEEIIKGGFDRKKQIPLNDDVKKEIIKDFNLFIEESDKIERGVLSPLGRLVISSMVASIPFLIKNAPAVVTLPQTIQRYRELNDPNQMENEEAKADKALGIAERNKEEIKRIKRLLQNSNMSVRSRRALEGALSRLEGNNGRK